MGMGVVEMARDEAWLAMGIVAVGLVYAVVLAVEAMGSSAASLLLPDYCCFPTHSLLLVSPPQSHCVAPPAAKDPRRGETHGFLGAFFSAVNLGHCGM
ncbi:hypothetical protein COCNU_01G015310 [Cocos nucifera]|uniref:Uncharacterized protein n=1 Tax=Cocos nucifera TaxID=13894 RepID=A0A8K0MV73_COCNU|nr:hypothetical protein COCNU_01G015310 [Cocos nucifera]